VRVALAPPSHHAANRTEIHIMRGCSVARVMDDVWNSVCMSRSL